MNTSKPAIDWTPGEIEFYLKELSYSYFRDRLAIFLLNYCACVVGALGNSLTFVIYLNRFPNNSTRMFVLGLSVTDLAMSVLVSPLNTLIAIYFYNFYSDVACKMIHTLKRILMISSILLLGVIAYDRYKHVCRPFAVQLRPRMALILVFATCALSCGVSIPFFSLNGLNNLPTAITGINGSNCGSTREEAGHNFRLANDVVSGVVFTSILFLMIYCYGSIGIRVTLGQLALARHKTNSRTKRIVEVSMISIQEEPTTESFSIGNSILKLKTSQDTKIDDSECGRGTVPICVNGNDIEACIDDINQVPTMDGPETPKDLSGSVILQISVGHRGEECVPSNKDTIGHRRDERVPSNKDTVGHRGEERVPSNNDTIVPSKTTLAAVISPLWTSVSEGDNSMQNWERKPSISKNINKNPNTSEPSNVFATAASDETSKDFMPTPKTSFAPVERGKNSILSFCSKDSISFSRSEEEPRRNVFHRIQTSLRQKGQSGLKILRHKHSRTTMFMFIITLLFLVFYLPYVIITSITPPHKIPCQGLPIVELNFCEMAIYYFPVLNSVVNPFVYSMFSYRFRQECKRYLCWFRKS